MYNASTIIYGVSVGNAAVEGVVFFLIHENNSVDRKKLLVQR